MFYENFKIAVIILTMITLWQAKTSLVKMVGSSRLIMKNLCDICVTLIKPGLSHFVSLTNGSRYLGGA